MDESGERFKRLEERLRKEREAHLKEEQERLRKEQEERLKECDKNLHILKRCYEDNMFDKQLVENLIKEESWIKEDLERLCSYKPKNLEIKEHIIEIERNKPDQTRPSSPKEKKKFHKNTKKKQDKPVKIDFDEDRIKASRNYVHL